MKRTKSQRRPKRKTVTVRKHDSGTTAIEIVHPDGAVVAGYDSLRVLITKDDGSWIAQGLEIDYAIDGDTIPEVKRRFQVGLAMTIESHLRVNGNIQELLTNAPKDVWDAYYDAKNTLHRYAHSQVLMRGGAQEHLPFDQILFVEPTEKIA